MPKHVAFITDGNRRYANKYNLSRREGYLKGLNKINNILNWCMHLGIVETTIYLFSIMNFKRSKKEIDNIMDIIKQLFKSLLENKEKLKDDGVCIRVIGNLSLLSEDLNKLIAEVMIVTGENNRIFINFAVAYTSRDEITHAIKDIIQGVKNTDILPEDINEDLITDCLYTYKSPNPDLLIRTSGETRLSDFLMWQISSTCIYFAKTFYRCDSRDARTFVESQRWSTQPTLVVGSSFTPLLRASSAEIALRSHQRFLGKLLESVQAFSRSHEWRATSSSSCRPRDDGSKRSTAIAVVRRELVGCEGVVFQGGTGADGSCGEGVRERRSEHENEQQRVQGNRRRSD
ncbi:DHDDS synthase, partial [Acromyrmex insinuator]